MSAAATPRESSSDDVGAPDVTVSHKVVVLFSNSKFIADIPQQSLIEQLNYAEAPRPFKNRNYAQKIAGNRRVKTAKQIIQLERERYIKPKKKTRGPNAVNTAAQSASVTAAGTPVDGMDLDDEAAQAAIAAAAAAEPEVVRKERYIACE